MWCRSPASFFCTWIPSFPRTIYWKRLFFPPLNCLDTIVKSIQCSINVRVYFRIQNWCICLSLCQYHKLSSKFWNKKVWVLQLCFFFRDCLALLGSLHFHMNFRISLSIFVKKLAGILIELHWIYRSMWRVVPS